MADSHLSFVICHCYQRRRTLDLRYYVSRFTFHVLRTTKLIAALVFTLLLLFIAWWFFVPRDDGTLADIQRRETLRVGLDASFPPFEVLDGDGQIVGLDVEIAQAVAADLGVEAELVNIGFDGLYDALLARRVDVVISGLPYDPRWTQDVAYTVNYFNAGQVLITRAGDVSIDQVADLSGRTVAVEWGSQADMEGRQLVEEVPAVSLLRQPTAAEAIASVSTGQADAAIIDAVSGLSAVPEVQVVTYLTDEWYAAAVHIESRALLGAVNQTLTRLHESGEMEQMQERWLRPPPPPGEGG